MAPVVAGAVVLAVSYNKFRLTTLLYSLILLHCIILSVGGHYTYAEVPLFDALKPVFNFERNEQAGALCAGHDRPRTANS